MLRTPLICLTDIVNSSVLFTAAPRNNPRSAFSVAAVLAVLDSRIRYIHGPTSQMGNYLLLSYGAAWFDIKASRQPRRPLPTTAVGARTSGYNCSKSRGLSFVCRCRISPDRIARPAGPSLSRSSRHVPYAFATHHAYHCCGSR